MKSTEEHLVSLLWHHLHEDLLVQLLQETLHHLVHIILEFFSCHTNCLCNTNLYGFKQYEICEAKAASIKLHVEEG